MAGRLTADQQEALDAMAREELGLDPSTLGGLPSSVVGSSFVLFAFGAIIPLVPFFFVSRDTVLAAIAAAAVCPFVIGAPISLPTGQGAVFSGMRQLVFGLLAAVRPSGWAG